MAMLTILVATTAVVQYLTAVSQLYTHMYSCYGNHSHTKIAPLVTKITYIKMDPLRSIRNGFVHGNLDNNNTIRIGFPFSFLCRMDL